MLGFRTLLAATIALGINAGIARASITTPVQTITFGPGLTDYANASQSLNLFDTTLGTLDSVTFTTSFGFQSTITVVNQGQGNSQGSVKTESAASYTSSNSAINGIITTNVDTAGTTFIGAQSLPNSAYDVTGQSGGYNVPTGTQQNVSSNRATTTNPALTDSAAADLGAFAAAGGGTFDILFNTLTGTNQTNTNGNSSSSQSTIATATFGISYTYDAAPPPTGVPEPASMALLGAGLLGVGMVRRR